MQDRSIWKRWECTGTSDGNFSFGVYNGSVARSCIWQLRRKLVMGVMAKADYTHKPSAFESEIHPSHKSEICTLCISPL